MINALLAGVDSTSPSWAARLAEVIDLLDRINSQLLLAHEQHLSALRQAASRTPADASSGKALDIDMTSTRGEDTSSSPKLSSLRSGSVATTGEDAGPSCSIEPLNVRLLALLYRRSGDAIVQEKHRPLAIGIGVGMPEQWLMPKGYIHLTIQHLSTLKEDEFDGQDTYFANILPAGQALELPTSITRQREDAATGTLHGWQARHWLRRAFDFARVSTCGSLVAPHAHLFPAATLLLLLCALDTILTLLLLGTLCSADEELDECNAILLIIPFAIIMAPLYGLFATLRVWLGIGNDVVKLLNLRELIDPRALSEASPGAYIRMIRRGTLWNAASMINCLVAFICTVEDHFFTSQLPWLLPLCLLANKLLLAHAYHLLASATGLVEGAHTLYTRIMSWEGPMCPRGPADGVMERTGGWSSAARRLKVSDKQVDESSHRVVEPHGLHRQNTVQSRLLESRHNCSSERF